MRFLWILLAAAAALVFFASSPAAAGVDGPCTILADGKNLAEVDEVVMPENGTISYDISSAAGVTSWNVQLKVAGFSQTVSEGSTEEGSSHISGQANVSQYATAGVGIYEVSASAQLADSQSCSANFLVQVVGNPLTTVAGAAAAAAAACGCGGLAWVAYLGFKP